MADTALTSSGGLQDVTATGAPIPDADTQSVTTSGGSLQEVAPSGGGGAVAWGDVADKPTTFPATPASVITAVSAKDEISSLVSPTQDYADMAEATAAIKSIIDALQAP